MEYSKILNIPKNIFKIFYNFFENENEIVKKIYLGNSNTLNNLDFIKKNNIKVIINCTPNIQQITESKKLTFKETLELLDIIKIRISINDLSFFEDARHNSKCINQMENELNYILPIIYWNYINNNNILIACHAGKQRSAIIVAAFLYKYKDLIPEMIPLFKDCQHDSDKIFEYIYQKRPQAFTYGFRINFKQSFDNYFQQSKSINIIPTKIY